MKKRLTKSRDQKLCGVFGGIAEYLNVDPTIITITHDLNLIVNADYMLDLGPRGGENGGQIVAKGKPSELAEKPESSTSKYLSAYWQQFK